MFSLSVARIACTIRYLKYHSQLFFRCATTARGLEWAYQTTFFDESFGQPTMGWAGHFHKLHYNAIFFYMVGTELEAVGKRLTVRVGEELTQETLQLYDRHCHEHVLPPVSPKKGDSLSGGWPSQSSDQVLPWKRRAGRPRKGGKQKRRQGHGWLMLVDPSTSRIVSVVSQDVPESNAVVSESLLKVLPLHKKVDLYIMDRACHYMAEAKVTEGLEQLKYYAVDRFHAHRHKHNCPCDPKKRRLKKRLWKLSTSVAEQAFSWFQDMPRS